MTLPIELLHQYTRLLDIKGESKNQSMSFTSSRLKWLRKDLIFKEKIKVDTEYMEDKTIKQISFSFDGYDFIAYGNLKESEI